MQKNVFNAIGKVVASWEQQKQTHVAVAVTPTAAAYFSAYGVKVRDLNNPVITVAGATGLEVGATAKVSLDQQGDGKTALTAELHQRGEAMPQSSTADMSHARSDPSAVSRAGFNADALPGLSYKIRPSF